MTYSSQRPRQKLQGSFPYLPARLRTLILMARVHGTPVDEQAVLRTHVLRVLAVSPYSQRPSGIGSPS
jgi:hypothetical protein